MNNRNMKPQEGQVVTQPRQKINAASALLTQEENETIFKLLGRKCQTLDTAVVQIFKTEGSAHSHWKKKHTGVVCFVKDSAIRSYFLRAYCLIKNELIWEHEIYDDMKIVKARPFLLTFEGQDGHVGLNFVSEDECDGFYRVVDATIETRNRKRMEKRNRMKPQLAPNAPDTSNVSRSYDSQTDSSVHLRNHPKINSITLTPAPMTTPAPQKSLLQSNFGLSSSSKDKDKKRKYTKADISTPTNFIHISHVGWNADKGFDLTGNEHDENLKTFFAKAGVSQNDLKDRDTREFIYDFIQSNNVNRLLKSEESVDTPEVTASAAPPPVPTRHHHTQNGTAVANAPAIISQRTAPPPPPPVRQPPPPVPSTIPGSGATTRPAAPPTRPPPAAPSVAPPPPPPPPPPTAAFSSAPVPPPPPPSMPMAEDFPKITTTPAPAAEPKAASSLPVINDTHSALMDSIRKGATLKKVDISACSTSSGDSRSDLMSEIRMGIELKPAQNRALPANRLSDDAGGTDALAEALKRALKDRVRVIQSSDDEETNDDEWDD